jgi:hypothetical protein
VEAGEDKIRIEIDRATLALLVTKKAMPDNREFDPLILESYIRFKRSGSGVKLVVVPSYKYGGLLPEHQKFVRSNDQLVRTLRQAHIWLRDLTSGKAASFADIAALENTDTRNGARSVRLAFLAPDIVESIVQGRQSDGLTAHQLLKRDDFPLCWSE